MAQVYQTTSVVLTRMLANYKSITGITLDPSQIDDSTLIKLMSFAGGVSFFTSQVQGAYNDMFPSSASEPALEQHLYTRSLPPRIQAQSAVGQIVLQGSGPGLTFPQGAQVTRTSDGSTFTSIQSGTSGSDGTVIVYFQSDVQGAAQNQVGTGNPFTLTTPVSGFLTACSNVTPFLDGRDLETPAEMFQRILENDQDENSGGNIAAYEAWAQEASPAVVTAKTIRFPNGPDTVATYITSGTTDIAGAVAAGLTVTRVPSAALIAQVQAYILTQNPVTDVHQTYGPTETPFNITVNYDLYTESVQNRAYVNAQINQVASIYLYSALSGDTINPTALERLIDQAVGDYISQRQVANFGGSVPGYTIPVGQILKPGTITTGVL